MANLRKAFLVSAVATALAAAIWILLTGRRRATDHAAAAPTTGSQGDHTRDEEIEALTQQQKDLMLRELSEHI